MSGAAVFDFMEAPVVQPPPPPRQPKTRRQHFANVRQLSPAMKAALLQQSKLRAQLAAAAAEKRDLLDQMQRQEAHLRRLQHDLHRSLTEIERLRRDYIPRAAINSIAAIHGTTVRVYAS